MYDQKAYDGEQHRVTFEDIEPNQSIRLYLAFDSPLCSRHAETLPSVGPSRETHDDVKPRKSEAPTLRWFTSRPLMTFLVSLVSHLVHLIFSRAFIPRPSTTFSYAILTSKSDTRITTFIVLASKGHSILGGSSKAINFFFAILIYNLPGNTHFTV